MPAIGMVLAWTGYTFTLWGYCLIRGWNVPLTALANPVRPYKWPAGGPDRLPDTVVLPVSGPALAAAQSAASAPAASPPAAVAGGSAAAPGGSVKAV